MTWEIPVALLGHAVAGAVLVLMETCGGPSRTVIDPDDVIVATAVGALQHAPRTRKATRVPDPPKGASQPKKKAPPPPPTASDMVLKKEDAPETEGASVPDRREQDAARERLIAQQKRDALLRDMTADAGTRDQAAASPDGVRGETSTPGATGAGDPELARYVESLRQAVLPNWAPLPSTIQSRPDLQVVVQVSVSSAGVLSDTRIVKGSGDASFDRTATLALVKTGRVPPPPEKWRSSASRGVQFRLYAKDKQ
ncbi:MAG: TonB family protein [Myxococcota bacterium]|nr:TonB family protein [Myxococcota bacterium]